MAAAIPVPGQKFWARQLFDSQGRRVFLPEYHPHVLIHPLDQNRHRVPNTHIVSHKFPQGTKGDHYFSAGERMASEAAQGHVTTAPIPAPKDAPEFSDNWTGDDKGDTQKTKEQLEAEKDG